MEPDRLDTTSTQMKLNIDHEKENEGLRHENRSLKKNLAEKINELAALQAAVTLLANHIARKVTSEPCPSERAVETAIRIIDDLRSNLEMADSIIRQYRRMPEIGMLEKDEEICWLRSRVRTLTLAIDDFRTSFEHYRDFIGTLESLIYRTRQCYPQVRMSSRSYAAAFSSSPNSESV